jgi:hypothetical protein
MYRIHFKPVLRTSDITLQTETIAKLKQGEKQEGIELEIKFLEK